MSSPASLSLLRCVEAIRIVSAVHYTIYGADRIVSGDGPTNGQLSLGTHTPHHATVSALAGDIYTQIYARISFGRQLGLRAERVPFVARLSAANSGSRGWEGGWALVARSGNTLRLRRDGFQIQALVTDVVAVPTNGGLPSYQINVGKELFNALQGWYVVLGESMDATEHTDITARFYFNIDAAQASTLVSVCCQLLNSNKIPFRLKVPDDPSAYGRLDTGVLYVRKDYYRNHREIFSKLFGAVPTRIGVPAFAKPLGKGVAVAEDPANGFSFGQHRSYLVAQGLVRAFLLGECEPERKLRCMGKEFQLAGLNSLQPHLAPLSDDIYDASSHEP